MKFFGWRGEFTLNAVRTHWNSVADVYDQWNSRYDSTHFQRFDEGIKYLPLASGQCILDVWARTGNASRYLLGACPEISYVGLELSEGLLHYARKKYPERNFIHGSMITLPFACASFDHVLSLETLEHIPDPSHFLGEVRRVLKDGGRLVLSTPPATAEWMTSLVDALGMNHGEGPRCFRPSREVKALLSSSGFRLLLHRGTVLIPAGPRFLRRWGQDWLEQRVQGTFLAEFGIRQFYVCEAVSR
jgi:ubiquinone/menaquinone biosynthesis C-methylase UbiE